LDAVRTLADLLSSRERQRIKKRQVFRDITVQHGIFDRPETGLPTGAGPSEDPARL